MRIHGRAGTMEVERKMQARARHILPLSLLRHLKRLRLVVTRDTTTPLLVTIHLFFYFYLLRLVYIPDPFLHSYTICGRHLGTNLFLFERGRERERRRKIPKFHAIFYFSLNTLILRHKQLLINYQRSYFYYFLL